MPKREPGVDCFTCGQTIDHRQATAHVGGCMRRATGAKVLLRAGGMGGGDRANAACLVRVTNETARQKRYVAYLLVRTDATLAQLDRAIREVWMEPCCGEPHLSWFTGDRRTHGPILDPAGEQANMTVRAAWHARGDGMGYGFDTRCPTLVRLDDYSLYRTPQETGVRLLATGQKPTITCDGRRARGQSRFCPETAIAASQVRLGKGRLSVQYACARCVRQARLPWRTLHNSPRSGACGYGDPMAGRQRRPLRQTANSAPARTAQ